MAGPRRVPPDGKVKQRQLPREPIQGVMKRVQANAAPVAICEPALDAPEFFGSKVTHDLKAIKAGCVMIVANRWSDEFADVADKVYTRHLSKRD